MSVILDRRLMKAAFEMMALAKSDAARTLCESDNYYAAADALCDIQESVGKEVKKIVKGYKFEDVAQEESENESLTDITLDLAWCVSDAAGLRGKDSGIDIVALSALVDGAGAGKIVLTARVGKRSRKFTSTAHKVVEKALVGKALAWIQAAFDKKVK